MLGSSLLCDEVLSDEEADWGVDQCGHRGGETALPLSPMPSEGTQQADDVSPCCIADLLGDDPGYT